MMLHCHSVRALFSGEFYAPHNIHQRIVSRRTLHAPLNSPNGHLVNIVPPPPPPPTPPPNISCKLNIARQLDLKSESRLSNFRLNCYQCFSQNAYKHTSHYVGCPFIPASIV